MKLKKTFFMAPLALSTAPIVAFAASCTNDGQTVTNYNLLPTYTGQADQLIALGIKPDYYPVQLDATGPFPYLTQANLFMPMQSEAFKNQFSRKLLSLIPADQGTSWWNQQALSASEKGSDPEFWTRKGGDMVLYERYLLDDDDKAIESVTAPKHYDSPETFIETNFRNSRDPYTRIPKNIIQGLLDQDEFAKLNADEKALVTKLLDLGRKIEGIHANELAGDGKLAPSGKVKMATTEAESWLYNDFAFARFWHQNFLDNPAYQNSAFKAWEVDPSDPNSTVKWVFSSKPNEELLLRQLFQDSTYRDTEASLRAIVSSNQNSVVSRRSLKLAANEVLSRIQAHHPIYEQQDEVGGAPMFEGAMRDNLLYLYTLAERVTNATKGVTEASKKLEQVFASTPERWAKMKNAFTSANKISTDLKARMDAIKVLVDAADNPTFGIFTLSPGSGASTIQSSSKFSFLYRELGFSQPMPTSLSTLTIDSSSEQAALDNLFNMDDNGWWWNISETSRNLNVSTDRVKLFEKQFDLGFMTANDAQFNSLKAEELATINLLWKRPGSGNETNIRSFLSNYKVDYNLWNEGLKAPFGMHMLVDQILKQFNDQYRTSLIASGKFTEASYQAQLDKAINWGTYFTQEFLA